MAIYGTWPDQFLLALSKMQNLQSNLFMHLLHSGTNEFIQWNIDFILHFNNPLLKWVMPNSVEI